MPEQNLFLPASKKVLKNPEMLKMEENSAQYLIKTILIYDKPRDCRMWNLHLARSLPCSCSRTGSQQREQDELPLLPRARLIFMAILKIMEGNKEINKLESRAGCSSIGNSGAEKQSLPNGKGKIW